MTKIDEIKSECEHIASLQSQLKAMAMIYQYDLKVEVAKEIGLNWQDLNLPYAQWADIRSW